MGRSSVARRLGYAALGVLTFSALGVGVIGYAHTPSGRPLLAYLPFASAVACPMGFDVAVSPEAREAGARRFAERKAGTAIATERPALGFALESSTRADVMAWAEKFDVSCREGRGLSDLECREVPSAALPSSFAGLPISSLWLKFGAQGQLLSVTTVRRDGDAERVSEAFRTVTGALTRLDPRVGPSEAQGSAQALAAAPLRQFRAEYRFSNYYASARATNVGDSFLLTEQYRALPPTAAPLQTSLR